MTSPPPHVPKERNTNYAFFVGTMGTYTVPVQHPLAGLGFLGKLTSQPYNDRERMTKSSLLLDLNFIWSPTLVKRFYLLRSFQRFGQAS